MTAEYLEEKLRQTAAALEAANAELAAQRRLAALGQIAAGIGHELRQPLSVIGTLTYCLRAALNGTGTSGVSEAEMLQRIDRELGSASRIISNLVEFARTQQPMKEPIEPAALVRRFCSGLRVPGEVELLIELPPALPVLHLDEVHLERILYNLCDNAIRVMSDSGGRLTLAGYATDASVILDVRDTGPGVPEELRDRIFAPLFSTQSRGLGLGLALVRQLAEANGGSITLQPPKGGGACFRLAFPIC